MKKISLLTIVILLLSMSAFAEYIKGSQYTIASENAASDESPVMNFDPDTGGAKGFIMYANLDGKSGDELIIPYRVRRSDKDIEDKALESPQLLRVVVITGKGETKKKKTLIEVELAYVRRPKVYMTVEQLVKNELPKVFLMVNDGFGKGWDKKSELVYNSLDSKDKDRNKFYETVKMPWKYIFRQFKNGTPSINEFETKLKENYGKFYIRLLDKGTKWPKIKMEDLEKFKKELAEHRKEIYWEYGYE